MYFDLFNDVTDAIELLKNAQIKAEEAYIASSEEEERKATVELKFLKKKGDVKKVQTAKKKENP